MAQYERCERESCRKRASFTVVWNAAPPTRVCQSCARDLPLWEAMEAKWLMFKFGLAQLPELMGPPLPDHKKTPER